MDPTGPPSPTTNLGMRGPDKVTQGCSFIGFVDECEGGRRSYHQVVGDGYSSEGFRLVRAAQ